MKSRRKKPKGKSEVPQPTFAEQEEIRQLREKGERRTAALKELEAEKAAGGGAALPAGYIALRLGLRE